MEKIKVIIKRPDEKVGHVEQIENTLEAFQEIVEGYMEVHAMGYKGSIMVCNEEGKLKPLQKNFTILEYGFFGRCVKDTVMGTVVICGTDGEDFTDVPILREEWEAILWQWGNRDTNR